MKCNGCVTVRVGIILHAVYDTRPQAAPAKALPRQVLLVLLAVARQARGMTA